MSVLKYKDSKGEVKKLFAPVIDSYSKTETYNKNETNELLTNKADLDNNGKVLSTQLPAMNYAPSTHASQHASTGTDPITPADIGAATTEYVDSAIQTAIGNAIGGSY